MRWFLLFLAACVHSSAGTIPVDPGMGTVHHAIETRSPAAQVHFDAGLALAYGFNYDGAALEFLDATRADPDCAMCWWGVAYVLGPNINEALKQGPGAYEMATRANGLAKTPIERALTKAMMARLNPTSPMLTFKLRAQLDDAYLAAMQEASKLAPADPDVQTLLAEALMMATPPFIPGWAKDGTARFPHIEESRRVLEKTVTDHPDHIGAIHFYIHIVDGSPYMDKVVPYAKKLAKLAPHAGHLVHMPSHLYLKLGRYAEAEDSNHAAIAADKAYLDHSLLGTGYSMFTMHPKQYLNYVLLWEGQSAAALKLADEMRDQLAKTAMDPMMASMGLSGVAIVATRFAQWDKVLALPDPQAAVPAVSVEYGRGLAYVAKGRLDDAEKQIAKVLAAPTVGQPPPPPAPPPGEHHEEHHEEHHDDMAMPGQPDPLFMQKLNEFLVAYSQACAAQLSGAIAAARGDTDKAISELRRAADLEDKVPEMDELSKSPYPARQRLGAVLLKAGKFAEAETVYREDLKTYPENGWSLFGLWKALEGQHKPAAAAVQQRFQAAWQRADIQLTSSVL
jgi:tetratricopeptide (TPR) repeat protein